MTFESAHFLKNGPILKDGYKLEDLQCHLTHCRVAPERRSRRCEKLTLRKTSSWNARSSLLNLVTSGVPAESVKSAGSGGGVVLAAAVLEEGGRLELF